MWLLLLVSVLFFWKKKEPAIEWGEGDFEFPNQKPEGYVEPEEVSKTKKGYDPLKVEFFDIRDQKNPVDLEDFERTYDLDYVNEGHVPLGGGGFKKPDEWIRKTGGLKSPLREYDFDNVSNGHIPLGGGGFEKEEGHPFSKSVKNQLY